MRFLLVPSTLFGSAAIFSNPYANFPTGLRYWQMSGQGFVFLAFLFDHGEIKNHRDRHDKQPLMDMPGLLAAGSFFRTDDVRFVPITGTVISDSSE